MYDKKKGKDGKYENQRKKGGKEKGYGKRKHEVEANAESKKAVEEFKRKNNLNVQE